MADAPGRCEPRHEAPPHGRVGGNARTGCGSDNQPKTAPDATRSTFARSIADAQSVTTADFPALRGKTLQALANTAQASPQVGLATSVLIPCRVATENLRRLTCYQASMRAAQPDTGAGPPRAPA